MNVTPTERLKYSLLTSLLNFVWFGSSDYLSTIWKITIFSAMLNPGRGPEQQKSKWIFLSIIALFHLNTMSVLQTSTSFKWRYFRSQILDHWKCVKVVFRVIHTPGARENSSFLRIEKWRILNGSAATNVGEKTLKIEFASGKGVVRRYACVCGWWGSVCGCIFAILGGNSAGNFIFVFRKFFDFYS